MDLANLDMTVMADAGATMTVMHPATGEPLQHNGEDVTITILGQDSTKFREEVQRRAKAQLGKRGKPDFDKIAADSADLLAACTTSWEGITENGQLVECSRENAKRIYEKYGWLRQQVDEFISDRANFFKA